MYCSEFRFFFLLLLLLILHITSPFRVISCRYKKPCNKHVHSINLKKAGVRLRKYGIYARHIVWPCIQPLQYLLILSNLIEWLPAWYWDESEWHDFLCTFKQWVQKRKLPKKYSRHKHILNALKRKLAWNSSGNRVSIGNSTICSSIWK